MNRFCRRFAVASVALTLFAACAVAKRIPPKPVAPVDADGIRYSAEGDGRDEYVVATDIASGKLLWKIKVFHNRIEFWIEEDNQWVFISDLKLSGNSLLIRDEKARCYLIDVAKRHRKKQSCGNTFPSQTANKSLAGFRDWLAIYSAGRFLQG